MIKGRFQHKTMDIWSLGVTLFELITCSTPFEGNTENKLFNNIINHRIVWPRDISDSAKDLLKKMLVQNPANRINIDQICHHQWVKATSTLPSRSCFSGSTSASSTRATSIFGLKLNAETKPVKQHMRPPTENDCATKLDDTLSQGIARELVADKPRLKTEVSESLKRSLEIKGFFPKRA